jgi:hypothetical protein
VKGGTCGLLTARAPNFECCSLTRYPSSTTRAAATWEGRDMVSAWEKLPSGKSGSDDARENLRTLL